MNDMTTGAKARVIIASLFIVAGGACFIAPSPHGATKTFLSWVIIGILAVAFVLDMRELRADLRAEAELEQDASEGSQETRIQVLDGGDK